MEREEWPVTDAFLTSSIERYVAECQRAGVRQLSEYRDYLYSYEASKQKRLLEEGTDPRVTVEKKIDKLRNIDWPDHPNDYKLSGSTPRTLVSPRLYELALQELEEAEKEIEEDEINSIHPESIYPWKESFDTIFKRKIWYNVETDKTSFEPPEPVWYRKLDKLQRLKKVGHVARQNERKGNFIPNSAEDLTQREERRLDAVVQGWEWEETEKEKRRRRYLLRKKKEDKHALRQKRIQHPLPDETIADTLLDLVNQVEQRLQAKAKEEDRIDRRLYRTSWHPACGRRHMRRIGIDPNWVDLEYLDVYLTECGSAYNPSSFAHRVLQEPLKIATTWDQTTDFIQTAARRASIQASAAVRHASMQATKTLLPTLEKSDKASHCAILLKKEHYKKMLQPMQQRLAPLLLRSEKSRSASNALKLIKLRRKSMDSRQLAFDALSASTEKQNINNVPARTARLELELALVLPPAYEHVEEDETQYLDTTARRNFQEALINDVYKAAGLTRTNRILIDEFITLRQDSPQLSAYFAETTKKSDALTTALKRDRVRERRRLLGWTEAGENRILVKFTLIHDDTVLDCAELVAKAARDPNSNMRTTGRVTCCAVEGRAFPLEKELGRSEWPQYWAYRVSPVFYGHKSRPFKTRRDLSVTNRIKSYEYNAELSDSDDEPCPEVLAPTSLKGTVKKWTIEAKRAEVAYAQLTRGKTVYDSCGRVQLLPDQLTAFRKMERARLFRNAAKRRLMVREERTSNLKSPPWWKRQVVKPTSMSGPEIERKDEESSMSAKVRAQKAHLVHKRTAALEAKAARKRFNDWRTKKLEVQSWLLRKLASVQSGWNDEPQVLLSEMARVNSDLSRTDGHLVDSGRREAFRSVEEVLRKIHHELAEDQGFERAHVRKRDLFASLCEPPISEWAFETNSAYGPLLRKLVTVPIFAKALIASPVKNQGFITEEEFVIFGLVLLEWEPVYQLAVNALVQNGVGAMNESMVSSLTGMSKRKKKSRKHANDEDHSVTPGDEESTLDFFVSEQEETGIEEEEEEKYELDDFDADDFTGAMDEAVYKRSLLCDHTHIYVRTSLQRIPYCCICRRRLSQEARKAILCTETKWTSVWSRRCRHKVKAKMPEICDIVASQRRERMYLEKERQIVALKVRSIVNAIAHEDESQTVIQCVLAATIESVVTAAAITQKEATLKEDNKNSASTQRRRWSLTGSQTTIRKESKSVISCPVRKDRLAEYAKECDILVRQRFGAGSVAEKNSLPKNAVSLYDLADHGTFSRKHLAPTRIEIRVVSAVTSKVLGKARLPWHLLERPSFGPLEIALKNSNGKSYLGATVSVSLHGLPGENAVAYLYILGATSLQCENDAMSIYAYIAQDDVEVGRTETMPYDVSADRVNWVQPNHNVCCHDNRDDDDNSIDGDSLASGQNLDYIKVVRHPRRRHTVLSRRDKLQLFRTLIREIRKKVVFRRRILDALAERDKEVEALRTIWQQRLEKNEEERRAMALEDADSRHWLEACHRDFEDSQRLIQEKGQQAFHLLLGALQECGGPPALARLRWLETIEHETTHAAHVCSDQANCDRVIARFIVLHHDVHARTALATADECIGMSGLAPVISASSHVLEDYNLFGTLYEKSIVVCIVTKLPVGGRVVDKLPPLCGIAKSCADCNRDTIHNYLYPRLTQPSQAHISSNATLIKGWMRDIAKVLSDLHARQIIHRNVHPGAIFIDSKGRAVLDDFLIYSQPDLTACEYGHGGWGAVIVAPECRSKFGAVTFKADVWAFGCSIFYWLYRKLPSLDAGKLRADLDETIGNFDSSVRVALEFSLQSRPHARASADELFHILSKKHSAF